METITTTKKTCSTCKIEKPVTDYRAKRAQCTTCLILRKLVYYNENKHKFKQYYKEKKQGLEVTSFKEPTPTVE